MKQAGEEMGNFPDEMIDWKHLVRDILDKSFMSQSELAERLKISQQCISTWLNGNRRPRPAIRKTLLAFSSGKGIESSMLAIDPKTRELLAFLDDRGSGELSRILSLYVSVPGKCRRKILRFAESLARR